jgi:transcriptional regulator with XRE-family HTH domain
MVIGDRLRELREAKKLSQGDIEERTGLLRCYISRVENNHTVPAVDTLEKLACALEVPMYQLFHSGEAAPEVRRLKLGDDDEWKRTQLRFADGEGAQPDEAYRPAFDLGYGA